MLEEKRVCRICSVEKEINLFEIDSRKKTVYTDRCKDCKNILDDKAQRAYRGLKRRSAKQNVPVEVTAREIRQLFIMFDGRCAYCGTKPDDERHLHLEHICALSEGGRNTLANLIPACVSCNSSKSSKPIVSHFLDNSEKFPDSNMSLVIDYMALLTGEKKEDVVKKMTDDHILYQLRQARLKLERAAT